METQKKEMINKIRISADISSNDNPSNYDYGGMVKIKSGDDVVFEFLLLNNSGLIDTSQIRALTLEVLDIGCLNAPEPRSVKLLASKTLLADEIVALESVDDFKTGKCNVSFAFSAQETIWGNGHKWIVLSGYSVDNSKTTFTQGWIETFAKYSAEDQILPDVQSPFIRKDYADALYLNMEANLADVEDVADARRNLSVYSYEEVRDLLAQSESNVIDAIDAKIDAGIAQDVQKNSTDIATHSANIASLAVAKANRGEFWFQGGSLVCANKWTTNSPFSLALTFSMTPEEFDLNALTATSDYQWLGTTVYSTGVKGFCLSLDIVGSDPRCVCIFYGATRTTNFAVENFKGKYCDGKPHSLFVILNRTTAIVRIDDDIYSANAPDYNGETNTRPFSIFKNTARFSRIKYFNFDMSDANAPYTIADYISGKDESPLLQLGVQSYNASDMVFSSVNQTTYPCGVVSDSATDTITITTTGETASEYTWIDGRANAIAIPQGANVEVSVGDLDVATKVQGYFYSGTTRVQTLSGVSRDNPTNSFVAPANLTRLSLIVHAGVNPIPTGTTLTITGLKIKVNGALLSLEDVKSGVQILDKSGNANNANISGTVYASKENNPARCVDSASFSWAGTMTTQKFANSDVAIPANSKVVAYAKASVGMSASFTCGGNSAVSKELSANTITEIGSFFNASQGAFKVAPSSATTGKMEVYLTIEKF